MVSTFHHCGSFLAGVSLNKKCRETGTSSSSLAPGVSCIRDPKPEQDSLLRDLPLPGPALQLPQLTRQTPAASPQGGWQEGRRCVALPWLALFLKARHLSL